MKWHPRRLTGSAVLYLLIIWCNLMVRGLRVHRCLATLASLHYPSARAVFIWDVHVFISYRGWYLMYVPWHCVEKKSKQKKPRNGQTCHLWMMRNFILNCEKSSEGLMMRQRPVVNEWANECVSEFCKEEENLCTFPQIQYSNYVFFKFAFLIYCPFYLCFSPRRIRAMHTRMQFTPAYTSMITKALHGQKMLLCVLLNGLTLLWV